MGRNQQERNLGRNLGRNLERNLGRNRGSNQGSNGRFNEGGNVLTTALFYIFSTFWIFAATCGISERIEKRKAHPADGEVIAVFADCNPVHVSIEKDDYHRGWVGAWPLCTFDWRRFQDKKDMERWLLRREWESVFILNNSTFPTKILEPAWIDGGKIEYFETITTDIAPEK